MSLSQVSECLSCHREAWPVRLLPHLAGVIVEEAVLAGGRVQIRARPRAAQAACPRCQVPSSRVHSRYERRLADAPVGGCPAVIRLAVRRFFCASPACAAVTFAEQVAGLTSRRARRTPVLAAMLTAAGLALAGRAGARLAAALGMPASRHALLRLVMALPGPDPGPAPAVLGVDDFSFRRGRTYGTLLIDMTASRPVDLLGDREAATLQGWLEAHPGAEVICRDRAGAYAEGARAGAPAAAQVADRWHLWHNLAGHVRDEAARHAGCLDGPGPQPPAAPDMTQAAEAAAARRAAASPLGARTLARHAAVQDQRAAGATITAAAAALGLSPATVRRFWQPAAETDLLATARGRRPSLLDPHKPWLDQRLAEGPASARQLHRELTARGYAGSYERVRAYLQPLRALAPPPPPPPPKAPEITRWITTRPGNLDENDTASLAAARARCPHLDALAGHVAAFAKILTTRRGHLLDAWITAADASDLPALHSFTRGLRLDPDAVRNALTLPWNSGKVEGHVTRLKMLKRQTYGRAGLPLLRQRVLHAT